MGKSNIETYNYAKSFLGKGGAVFRAYCGLPGGAAWCDAFVTYVFHKTNNASLFCGGKKQTYCPNTIKILRKELAEVPPFLVMPGDIILFDWERNGVPNHIGLVRSRNSANAINTIEGNTDGGRVANKVRNTKYVQAVFRPHFAPPKLKNVALSVDGEFEYQSIAGLQRLVSAGVDGILGLKTVKAVQAYFGASQDGAWGKGTSKAIQGRLAKAGYYTGKIDGEFGPASVNGLQRFINAKVYPTPVKKPETSVTKKPAASIKSYRIDVDLTNQICTVYGIYSDESEKPIMSEWVSTARKGKTTPTGLFKIQGASGGRKAKLRTAKMSSGKAYAEFLCRFHGAKCMHTVPYKSRQTTGHVNKAEFNKLGTPRSAGCVRMPWKLAHFIYETCPIGTPVKVFKGRMGNYPMGKPKYYKATSDVDPTYKK